MDSPIYQARVFNIRQLTDDVYEFTLEFVDPPALQFLPGQSIALTVPGISSRTSLLRYYSPVSLPDSSRHMVILMNGADQGEGSTFLLSHQVGDDLQVLGPFGSFHLHDDPDRDALFVGTGTGIAPLRSMLCTLFHQSFPRSITLLWGLRSESDVYYVEDFQDWATQYHNFSFLFTLSQPSSSWRGRTGRVTHLLNDYSGVDHLAAYVCGNRAMVEEVIHLLQQKGNCPIYRERYYEED